MSSAYEEKLNKMQNSQGFIAALDQSGGSTPGALKQYGVPDDSYKVGEPSMFDAVHQMRTRIITSPSFDGSRVLGVIMFEDTMDRQIMGRPTSSYLWEEKGIVPFVKVDQGLADEKDGVQLMKPLTKLQAVLKKAQDNHVFGTKMRSVIKLANADGISAIVAQQFEVGKEILAAGLHPIIEPEVDIKSPEKKECEALLKASILEHLNALSSDQKVFLKLTLPSVDNFYKELCEHPNVIRVVALSGGYSRVEANSILKRNHGVIASFSRALAEDLFFHDTDEEFNAKLDASVQSIFDASD